MNKQNILKISVCLVCIAIVGLAGFYGYTKLMSLRKSYHKLTYQVETIGRFIGETLSEYQRTRGAAKFTTNRNPSPFSTQGKWVMIGGQGVNRSWEADRFEKSRSFAVHRGKLFVGLGGNGSDDAQVWSYDGSTWEQVGGSGIYGSWRAVPGYRIVNSLISHSGLLYAGVGGGGPESNAEVWAYNEKTWTRVGGPQLSWQPDRYERVYSMATHKGLVYVGLTVRSGVVPAVYRYDGAHWEKVAGDGLFGSWGLNNRYRVVYELFSHDDGFLYAGMAGPPGSGDVWRFNGRNWEQIGGDGIKGSWKNSQMSFVLSLTSYQGKLIASLPRYPVVEGDFVSIWAFDGQVWKPVGIGNVPSEWSRFHNYNFLFPYRGSLIVGAGGHPVGNASLWQLQFDNKWIQVAGNGIGGSWGGDGAMVRSYEGTMEYVYRMTEYEGDLIVGFGDRPGVAQVWRYSP